MREEGYSLVEMVVVMAILGVIIGGVVTIFTAGINADADQTRRYQAQEDARVSLDKMRREIHSACTVSNPGSSNTWQTSITLYFGSDSCAAGTNSVTWCTIGSGSQYALWRAAAVSCTAPMQKFADFLTSSSVFLYLPPNSHVTTLGGGLAGLATADGSGTLPRLHVELTINRSHTRSTDRYHLVDDIAFRNGPRACTGGAATC